MSKEYNLISDFDYRIIAAFFAGLDRQGPGDDAQTRRALSFIDGLPPRPRIADIGCGTGRPDGGARIGARRPRHGRRPAAEMIEGLHRRMETEGRTEQVTGIVASMLSLPFAEASFDLLWAEGSIYNIGFEKGLTQWRRFLKPDGFIAITECSWLSSARPDEMVFFRDNFPEIDDISGKIRCMERPDTVPSPTSSCPIPAGRKTTTHRQPPAHGNFSQPTTTPLSPDISSNDWKRRSSSTVATAVVTAMSSTSGNGQSDPYAHAQRGPATDVAGPRSVRPLPVDHPRTNQRLPVVPDGELAGRDAPLGLVEKQIPALVAHDEFGAPATAGGNGYALGNAAAAPPASARRGRSNAGRPAFMKSAFR